MHQSMAVSITTANHQTLNKMIACTTLGRRVCGVLLRTNPKPSGFENCTAKISVKEKKMYHLRPEVINRSCFQVLVGYTVLGINKGDGERNGMSGKVLSMYGRGYIYLQATILHHVY